MLAGLSAATSGAGRGSGRSLVGRLSYAAASGACIGAYLALEFVPGEPLLQVQHRGSPCTCWIALVVNGQLQSVLSATRCVTHNHAHVRAGSGQALLVVVRH